MSAFSDQADIGVL